MTNSLGAVKVQDHETMPAHSPYHPACCKVVIRIEATLPRLHSCPEMTPKKVTLNVGIDSCVTL